MSHFTITTAIDYVNGAPHLGHAYEKICADAIARWRRMCGDQVFFLTGTDEHGAKVQKTALALGKAPREFVDGLVPVFQEAWELLEISHDRFIRTTDADHEAAVNELLRRVHERGFLDVRPYVGWYCEGCEAYKTEKDLKDGRCPDHPTRTPVWLEEENLFFRLSAFAEPLSAWIAADPTVIGPESRRNEVLGWLRDGLEDLSISRPKSSVSWGIEIPFRPDSTLYVWFDALINYVSGAGFGTDPVAFAERWPADLHVIGKDITRFHCVIWPAMLMAAGLPPARRVFAHGWVLVAGERMSKSSGVGVEPAAIARQYGAAALRWFLLTEVSFGRDGEFSWQRFEELYNAHLANGLGNLLSRAITMACSYFGCVPDGGAEPSTLLKDAAELAGADAASAWTELRLQDAAASAWRLVTLANEQIQAREPWKLAKDEARRPELARFLYDVLESLRVVAVLLFPVLPGKSKEILAALGEASGDPVREDARWGRLPVGRPLVKPQPLFPRLEAARPGLAP